MRFVSVCILSLPLCLPLQGSRRSDEEALEEQVRKLGEESRTLRELFESEQSKARASQEEVLQLHNQVQLTRVRNTGGLRRAAPKQTGELLSGGYIIYIKGYRIRSFSG